MCMSSMKFGTFKLWVYQITVSLFSIQVASVRSQSSAQSKAKFFLKLLKSKDVITFAHFLIDVLTVISTMSTALQKRGTCVYEVHRQLELTSTNLQKLESRYFEKM